MNFFMLTTHLSYSKKGLSTRCNQRHYLTILILLLTINFPLLAVSDNNLSQQIVSDQKLRFESVGDAIRAINSTSDEQRKNVIVQSLPFLSIKGEEDVQIVYDQMKVIEDESKIHLNTQNEQGHILETQGALSKTLANAQSPEMHAKIADLLDKERKDLPRFFIGAREAKSNNEYLKEMPRTARLEALMTAAGEGKNKSALPTLRKMAQRSDMAGMLAVRAISQIGDPQDLDDFIRRIKSDPKARLDLSGYGPMLADRILSEINDASLSKETKHRLAGYLVSADSRESIPRIWPLLRDKDRVIARIAAESIVRSANKDDYQVLIKIASEPNADVRAQVLCSIDDRPWDPNWSSILIQTLKNDSDDGCRMCAAHILGTHKVQEGKSALQNAKVDKSVLVRGAAESALQNLSK